MCVGQLSSELSFFAFLNGVVLFKILVIFRGGIALSQPKEMPNVELKDRFLLTFYEASAYFGIGVSRLREICKDPRIDFIVQTGEKKVMIVRPKLEEYIMSRHVI